MIRRALPALLAAVGVFAPSASAGESVVTLNWVGDMSFSRSHGLPPNGGNNVFDSVRPLLTSGDFTTGNLEGNLGRGGPSKCKGNCHAFQAPPSYARVFRRAGFRLLNMANNHTRDFGVSGIKQAVAALSGAGVTHTGLTGQITVQRIRGVRFAFLGFAPYAYASPLLDIGAARKQVGRAARRADVVVVFIHAGAEGSGAAHTPHGTEHAFGENRGAPRAFAHAVVDAGADAVLGSGPHVLRGIECYKRAIVAYSLGNFAGYNTLSSSGVLALSGVLRLRLTEKGRFDGGRLWPVRIARPGVPRRDSGGESIRFVRRLSRDDFGKRACPISKKGVITPR